MGMLGGGGGNRRTVDYLVQFYSAGKFPYGKEGGVTGSVTLFGSAYLSG